MEPPAQRKSIYTLKWAGQRIGYSISMTSRLLSGEREASMATLQHVERGTGWQIVDQVQHIDDYGNRLDKVLETFYLSHLHPGYYRCSACGVMGQQRPCWNCGADFDK